MTLDTTNIPQHIAIIMDGNRRWAKQHGLQVVGGHNYVVDKVIEPLIQRCGELGVEYLTLWAFSTENWKRDEGEVSGIMQLFKRALLEKVEGFVRKGARLRMIGDMSRFSPEIQEGMKRAIAVSQKNDKITVTFALNYGGRDEIVRAVAKLMDEHTKVNPLQESATTEEVLAEYLDTAGMPDPDLIIRTGGEQRLSGFMLWQSAYSELYFTEKLMPEFDAAELEKALIDFQGRQRRFGK